MIYDISQPVFGCEVYPGDPKPEKTAVCDMQKGDLYNMTSFSMCAHNGTHVDAPLHFIKDGKSIDQLDLERLVGPAYVVSHEGDVTRNDAAAMVHVASWTRNGSEKRLLIKGNATVTLEAARTFADLGVWLIGNESQSVGPVDAPMAVHQVLLGAEVVLLEGIRLGDVPDGPYFLCCAPINLNGAEGAPCRALLMDDK